MSVFCKVDDKHIPLYRVMWISDLPHFCGTEDCRREGQYEIRLEHEEAVWASRAQRDAVMAAIEAWRGESESEEDHL